MRPCLRAGCPFAATWHATHCCARCVAHGQHGPYCDHRPIGTHFGECQDNHSFPRVTGLWPRESPEKILPNGTIVQECFIDSPHGQRSYLLHRPRSTAPPPTAYVVCFHGSGGSPDYHVSEWAHLVAAGAVVGVYARGLHRGWTLGEVPLCMSDPQVAAAISFVESMIKDVEARVPQLAAGPNQSGAVRFAHGFSAGAGMVQLLACLRPALFVAGSAFATQLREGQRPQSGPIHMLQVCGVNDDIIPYHGGLSSHARKSFEHAERSAQLWAEHNQCKVPPAVRQGAAGTLFSWEGSAAGGPRVVHLGLREVGHGILAVARQLEDAELGLSQSTGGLLGLVWEFYRAAAAAPLALPAFPAQFPLSGGNHPRDGQPGATV